MKTALLERLTAIEANENWMKGNQVVEATLEEERLKKEEKPKRPVNTKPYKPSKAKMDEIRQVSESAAFALKTLSPFVVLTKEDDRNFTKWEIDLTQILKKLIPFQPNQINRMSTESKQKSVEAILDGVQNTLRKDKDMVLDKGTYFYSSYQEKRLKIMMDTEEEPVILPESDFYAVEEFLLATLRQELLNAFELTKIERELRYFHYNSDSEDGIFRSTFITEALKLFSFVHQDFIEGLSKRYAQDAEYTEEPTEKEILSYRAMKVCPISAYFPDVTNEDDIKTLSIYFRPFFEALTHIHKLLTPENFMRSAAKMVDYYEFFNEHVEKNHYFITNMTPLDAKYYGIGLDKKDELYDLIKSTKVQMDI